MGYSIPFSDLTCLREFYAQAGAAAAGGSPSNDYSNYMLYDLIHSFAATHNLSHYIHPDVALLAGLDQKNGKSVLLLTLYTYLLNDKSYKLSAAKLHIHHSTFAYRLHKIFEFLHCSPDEENTRMSLLISTGMYWYSHPEADPIGISRWAQKEN